MVGGSHGERMPIGRFAEASGISIPRLRRWQRTGVLQPAAIDHLTGYRTYAYDQVATAQLLDALAGLGLPVAEASRLAHAPSSTDTDEALARIDARLARARGLLAEEEGRDPSAARRVTLRGGWCVHRRLRLPVHAVIDTLRRIRSRAGVSGRAHPWWDDDGGSGPAGPALRLDRPTFGGGGLVATYYLRVGCGRSRPAAGQLPAGWQLAHRLDTPARVLEVTGLPGADLHDVHRAHQDLAAAAGGQEWQIYSADLSRLWVARVDANPDGG